VLGELAAAKLGGRRITMSDARRTTIYMYNTNNSYTRDPQQTDKRKKKMKKGGK
jgi:hypothetical protein